MDSLAAVFREVGAPVSIERITLDPPGPTEVLVRIAAVGLCRTDLHVMRGERRVAMRPMVLGHEAAGVVEAIGAAVDGIAPGDHVVLTFIPGCGSCRWCRRRACIICAPRARASRRGRSSTARYRRRDRDGATVGAFCMIGGFAERTVVDQASVVVDRQGHPARSRQPRRLRRAGRRRRRAPARQGASPATACWWSAAAATA